MIISTIRSSILFCGSLYLAYMTLKINNLQDKENASVIISVLYSFNDNVWIQKNILSFKTWP